MTITQISGTVFADDAPGYDVVRLPHTRTALLDVDAAAWRDALAIEWGPEPYRTRFRACWDPLALHVRFDAADDSPWHTMTTRDDHIWEEEVVEIFLDADGSGRNYAELEISPANVVCDLRVASPWPSLRVADRVGLGRHDDGGRPGRRLAETGRRWRGCRGPGLRSLYPAPTVGLPPGPGEAWRFNVFRIKRPGGRAQPHEGVVLAAWSKPAGPSFHDPAAFRPLLFR